jgi:DNA-binding GntR family transcriptional regulator
MPPALSAGYVASEKLAEGVLRHLSRDIVSGVLAPGQRLIELQLAAELGVSRSPVREAIHRLATEGLVEIRPRRGAFVAALTPKDLQDVFDVREQLERTAAGLAASSAGPERAADLAAIDAECTAAAAAGDVAAFFASNDRLHNLIAELSGNAYLRQLQRSAAQRSFRALFLLADSDAFLSRSVQEHHAIVEAISRGDRAAAETAMGQHLHHAGEAAVALLRRTSPAF